MKTFALLIMSLSSCAIASTPWERFLDKPTAMHAAQVEDIAYTVADDFNDSSDDLQILKLQVLASDPAAFKLTYRLSLGADVHLAEELGAILASAIRPNPEFFLRQVSEIGQPCREFDVNVAGLEYVDRTLAQSYELRMRAEAIARVTSHELAHVRADCLAQLAGLDEP